MERKARRRIAPRGRRVPPWCGHRLPPAERVLSATLDAGERWETNPATRRTIPSRRHEEPGRVVVAEESVPPHATDRGTVRADGDGQQLGHQVAAKRAIPIQGKGGARGSAPAIHGEGPWRIAGRSAWPVVGRRRIQPTSRKRHLSRESRGTVFTSVRAERGWSRSCSEASPRRTFGGHQPFSRE